MFCSKCGAKIEEKDKFCPKCGHSVSGASSADEKEKNDKPAIAATEAKPKNSGCLSCLYVCFVIIALSSFIGALSYASTNKDHATGLVLGAFLFFAVFVFLGVWGLVDQNRKNRQAQIKTTSVTAPLSDEEKKRRGRNGWIVLDIIFIIISFIALGYSASINSKTGEAVWAILLLVLIFLFFLFIRPAIIRLIKAFRERPWRTGVITGAIILGVFLVIVLPIMIIISYSNDKDKAAFGTFQDSFASVLSAKYLGDDIVAGKSNADFATVKTMTQTALDALSKEKTDDKYEIAVYDWAGKINTAAANKKTWKNLPDLPSGIGEVLSSKAAENYYQTSLDRVAATKDYGDWAVAKGDKDTMRQIAASLETEAIWQDNLADTQTSFEPFERAYARVISVKTPVAKLPRGGCKGVAPCHKKTSPLIHGLSQAARNYSVGEAAANEQWNNAWKDMLNIININGGYNLEGMGVIKDGKTTTETSPMEQAFSDECKVKGGTTGGTGGVKDRLPTTLTAGGLNCDYKDNGHTCWDTMTRIGQRFMGGENGCPEQGLLPKPVPAPAPKPTPTEKGWDGTYNIQYAQGKCTSKWTGVFAGQNMPTTDYSSILVTPFSNTVSISNSKLSGTGYNFSAIDASGKTSGTFDLSSAYGKNVGKEALTFTKDANGAVHFTGTFTLTTELQGMSIYCTQPVSGQRK